MKRKSFFLSLVFAMLFFLFGGNVNVQAETSLEPYTYINPVYKDVLSDALPEAVTPYSLETPQNVSYTDDVQQLAATLRQQMLNRTTTIHLYYHSNTAITQDFLDRLSDQLFNLAVAHTGNGKEGDYLRWHCEGWTLGASYSSASSGYNMDLTFTMYYLSDASQEAQMDQAVSSLISSLNLSVKNEYQKAKAIYDYMCSNITYDYKNLNDPNYTLKFSAYAALINKTSVCQGYATLFYRLALEAGLDARVIAGVAGGGNHAWNIVKINGSYYNLDSTWDAGRDPYDYFLKNMNDFSDHDRNADYTASDFVTAYPMSATSYDESAPIYGEPTYEWAADYSSVTAKRLCETDGTYETETVETTKEVTDPTCTKDGSITYRAVFTNAAFKAQTKTVAGAKAFGHDFQNDICTRCNARRTGAWVHSGSRWWYRYSDGTYPANELRKIGNSWFGFDAAGWMETGWAAHDNNWYYFASSGAMQTGWLAHGKSWYYFDGAGKMMTGFITVGKASYYMLSSGQMATGWQKIGNYWYYFAGSGAMQTGWLAHSKSWYYLDGTGKMTTGFITVKGATYYLNGSGQMVTGWLHLNNDWYYFAGSGAMTIGWQKVGNYWYYLDENGKMATNTWIGNWYVNGSGAWVRSR
ncbi:transglutaminase domain-containing protein [Blautia sp.]|uniref:transglutaminase domain-containing protein n=1 Tax=Blautia sp. TaxID=1955243 RepID=UPI00257E1E48|nr:transglutaminase domain-containing protein [Blautia sp.]